MNISKRLPMKIPPLLDAYPIHSNITSILSVKPESMLWFYEYYLLLCRAKSHASEIDNYIDFYAPIPWRSCPWIDHQIIGVDTFLENELDLVAFIKNSISMNYYIFLNLDRFYIPVSKEYENTHRTQEALVFGFNDEQGYIDVADHFFTGKYGLTQITYDELKSAFYNAKPRLYDPLGGILLLKVRDVDRYAYDIKKTIRMLKNYLNGSDEHLSYSEGIWIHFDQHKTDYVFGLDIYDLLIEYLWESHEVIDLRGLQALYNHKILLRMCVEHLYDIKLLADFDMVESAKKIEIQSLTARNLGIKFDISSNRTIIPKIAEMLIEIHCIEKELITNIISKLDN